MCHVMLWKIAVHPRYNLPKLICARFLTLHYPTVIVRNCLESIGTSMKKTFIETIDKLQAMEPEIKAEAAKGKSDKALADKVYGVKGTKRDSNGTPRVADANKTTCKTCN